MKLAIMQPYFFPYIGYFQLIKSVDKYIIYDNLNFIKEAWVNRNKLLVKNSGSTWITLPLKHQSSFTKICDIEIDNTKKWRGNLRKTLELNYRKAPMFSEVFPLIDNILDFPTQNLSDFNAHSIIEICKYLNINTHIEYNADKFQFLEQRLSDTNWNSTGNVEVVKKVQRVFDICNIERADTFYNAIGGTELYSKELFKKNGIDIHFIKTRPIVYKQFENEFIPALSIIDVMMFNEKNIIDKMLNEYDLV